MLFPRGIETFLFNESNTSTTTRDVDRFSRKSRESKPALSMFYRYSVYCLDRLSNAFIYNNIVVECQICVGFHSVHSRDQQARPSPPPSRLSTPVCNRLNIYQRHQELSWWDNWITISLHRMKTLEWGFYRSNRPPGTLKLFQWQASRHQSTINWRGSPLEFHKDLFEYPPENDK